jgi:hypothetical protein
MLRRVLAKAPGLRVVGEAENLAELRSLVNQSEPHWVIVSLWPVGEVPWEIRSLLRKHPPLCFLGLAADSSQIRIICSGSTERTLEDISLDHFIGILKDGR